MMGEQNDTHKYTRTLTSPSSLFQSRAPPQNTENTGSTIQPDHPLPQSTVIYLLSTDLHSFKSLATQSFCIPVPVNTPGDFNIQGDMYTRGQTIWSSSIYTISILNSLTPMIISFTELQPDISKATSQTSVIIQNVLVSLVSSPDVKCCGAQCLVLRLLYLCSFLRGSLQSHGFKYCPQNNRT